MNKVDINVTKSTEATISLIVGDVIVDSEDNKAEVFYIDYNNKRVIVGSNGNSAIVPFDVIAGGDYQQVIED